MSLPSPGLTQGEEWQRLAKQNLDPVIAGKKPFREVSANYTADATDYLILVDATGGARTITLPKAETWAGFPLVVKKVDSSANAVTIDGNGSETIDGATTYALSEQYDSIEILSDGEGWQITSASVAPEAAEPPAATLDGAKVRKSAALTGQNITAALTAVTWDAEDWDTGGYHSTVSNTDRLTVTNAGHYECKGQLNLGNTATGSWVIIEIARYNSSAVKQETLAMQMTEISAAATVRVNVSSTGSFASGDFLRMNIQTESDPSTDISADSWLEIRLIA